MRKMPTTKQIDELQKMIDNGGAGGDSKIFVAIKGTTTFNELKTAYLSGEYDYFVAKKIESDNSSNSWFILTRYVDNQINNYFEFTNFNNFGSSASGSYLNWSAASGQTTGQETNYKHVNRLFRHSLLVQATDVVDSNEVLSGKYVITMMIDYYNQSETAITTATFYTKMPKSVLIPAVIKVFKDTRVNPGDAISYTDTVETGAFALAIHESPAKYVIDAGPGYITCIFPEFEFTTIRVLDDSVSEVIWQ